MLKEYDVVVVGAGHAGNEAAAAAANLGSSVLMVTMNMETIGQMSCNPAIGGIAKGQIVREIDALGGLTGKITDLSAIQFKLLNRSKGPAMWSPRAQCDRKLFSNFWREHLEAIKNLDFWQDMVTGVIVKKNKVVGVETAMGVKIKAKSVVLNSGTFLNGSIHLGEKKFGGGRMGDKSSCGITEQLENLGFKSGRMKTGTPPRVDGRSLNFKKMEEQPGDDNPGKFSFFDDTRPLIKQKSCFITYTNDKTHDILRSGFERSPLFNGAIKSLGPRYCPSIEDKINRFSHRPRHQIFAEPEGWNTIEFYINGFSSSLPEEIQLKSMQTIPGFEKAKMFRPGYAVEYDYFPPTQLKHSLETKLIENLFFSGQINGTTGYEEAAGQGIMAGINAHLKINEKEPLILSRDQAYIGVLIDDLITKGTEEPYRMFTSRAEYRILLRQDNADLRLSKIGNEIGLLSNEKYNRVLMKIKESNSLMKDIKKTSLRPSDINPLLREKKSKELAQKVKAISVLSRPNINIRDVVNCSKELQQIKNKLVLKDDVLEQTEINIKYNGYIQREKENADKLKRLEHVNIPEDINYFKFSSLSTESKEKLNKIKPTNIGQAARISGIKPSDISILLIYLGR
ncbi:MAG: tRNA uridine-5-carboxymethylaminomethyl(34) synthesis enzyme MnmG [Crocinitomicaceae bacterium]|nr:tRNA uridine-5-carboxymethylaminomethyl(34) synthesis enzyme MnmG [Crocinitomicaceae bacterium]|tara:strand:- start:12122 stop:13993 length:1872 start_codon:yes stop_codon:yes gene_type:complete